MIKKRWNSLGLLALLWISGSVVHAGVSGTAHDLSATVPEPASKTVNACVFCHTPHNAVTTRALWNRELPTVAYELYESSTLGVELRQPTGATRLCLSCHDGTLALGAMRTHPDPDLGPLTGPSVLGTDLSDDHPVSFVYDSQVAARLPELVHPSALTGPVKLDSTEQMQCTTCHDPHEERYPHFLVTDTAYSQLCISCHQKRMWDGSSHATSVALVERDPSGSVARHRLRNGSGERVRELPRTPCSTRPGAVADRYARGGRLLPLPFRARREQGHKGRVSQAQRSPH